MDRGGPGWNRESWGSAESIEVGVRGVSQTDDVDKFFGFQHIPRFHKLFDAAVDVTDAPSDCCPCNRKRKCVAGRRAESVGIWP
jgi:hypothetical protein